MKNNEHLTDTIEYENEHTCLDFKKAQYVKENYASLLKDVIAMANAIATGDKYIVIGVKHFPDGNREIHPIENFVDSATYQQIIRENIEPELHIEYEPYQHEQGLLGIFHLLDCTNPPYLLKKDFSNLKKGDCFIRKGSHQTKISRTDLDKIYEIRNKACKFSGAVNIGFIDTNFSQEITLSTVSLDNLPSQKAAKKIREILKDREKSKAMIPPKVLTISNNLTIPMSLFGSRPYEERSNEALEKNLADVKKDYAEDDQYDIMEMRAFHLNFEIFNNGDEYIQDASIKIEIQKNDKCYRIAKEIIEKPDYRGIGKIPASHMSKLRYPTIRYCENKILISKNIENIKHKMITKVFDYDIRLAVIKVPENDIIPIDLKLFAKNLPSPIHKILTIKVIKLEQL